MADAELNVFVKVSDDGGLNKVATRFNELIDKWRAGRISADEMTEAIRIGTKMFNGMDQELNKEILPTLGKTVAQMKDAKSQAVDPLSSSVQKNQRAYFDLGREMRQWFIQQRAGDRVMREFGQTTTMLGSMMGAGGLTSVVNTAQGAFQQMQFSAVALGKSFENAGGKLEGLGKMLVGSAGIIGGAVAAISVMIMLLKEMKDTTEAAKTATNDWLETLVKVGKIRGQGLVDLRKAQLESTKKEGPDISFWKALLAKGGFGAAEFQRAVAVWLKDVEEKTKAVEDAEKSLQDSRGDSFDQWIEDGNFVLEQQKLLQQAMNEESKLRVKEIDAWWDLHDAIQAANDAKAAGYELREQKLRENEDRRRERNRPPAFTYGEMGEMILDKGDEVAEAVSGTGHSKLFKEMEATRDSAKSFTDDLSSGIMNATQGLTQGFIKAFNLGEGLLGQFAASMLATFAQIGTKALIGNVLSMIPGLGFLSAVGFAEGGILTEPVVGVGVKSGRVHTFAERGPESFSPMNAIGQMARYDSRPSMRPSISVVPIVNNTGLAVQVEVGNRINKTIRRY